MKTLEIIRSMKRTTDRKTWRRLWQTFRSCSTSEQRCGVDHLEALQNLSEQISDHAIDSQLHLRVWQRDCDCAEWTEHRKIPATVQDYLALERDLQDNAEGPVSISVMSAEDIDDFQPSHRDRVMEAFENGNPYNV